MAFNLERISTVRIEHSDIDELGRRDFGFLSAILFMANELYFYEKILISTLQPQSKSDIISECYFINSSIALRNISSKLYTFYDVLESEYQKWKKLGDSEKTDKFKDAKTHRDSAAASPFYKLSKRIRDKFSYHLDVGQAAKNTQHISKKSRMSAYLHKERGNSFFQFAEEACYLGLINGFIANEVLDSEIKEREFIRDWIDWILAELEWVHGFCEELAIHFLAEKLGKSRDERMLIVPSTSVATIGEFFMPLFLRKSEES